MYSLYKVLFGEQTSHNFYYLSLIKTNDKWFIHGLWPQIDKHKYPTFCKKVVFDINKLAKINDKLQLFWHSDREKDEAFWKHEWEKHGSCMFNNCDEFQYFNTTLKLYQEAINKNLPEKYFSNNKCLIPVNLDFEFI